MIYSSLVVLAMSASALVNPFSNRVHLHPHKAVADSRINITLTNESGWFRDLKIDGKMYTVMANNSLDVKAPAGTVVYAASKTPTMKVGDAIVELKPELNNHRVILN